MAFLKGFYVLYVIFLLLFLKLQTCPETTELLKTLLGVSPVDLKRSLSRTEVDLKKGIPRTEAIPAASVSRGE